MSALLNKLFRVGQQVYGSIAFIPSAIAAAMFLFCVLMVSFEYSQVALWMKDALGIVLVTDPDSARTILGALIGGTISLTVFSFSMVMIVLTRASSALSPRVIPGLVTQRQNQATLGFYIGSIIHALILVASIHGPAQDRGLPRLGIFFAVVFAIVALGLFVNFIHSITKSIQVDHVMESIYLKTKAGLDARLSHHEEAPAPELPDAEGWVSLPSACTGYYKKCNSELLVELLKEEDLQVLTLVERGDFVASGRPLVKVNKQPSDEVSAAILDCFAFYIEEYTHDHYVFGFHQLSEIAVKALSPGINDPGTATRAVDLLSVLLGCYAAYPDHEVLLDEEGRPRVFFDELDFRRLLMRVYGPIRHYGRADAVVVGKLIESCANIGYGGLSEERRVALRAFLEDLVALADQSLEGAMDRGFVNEALAELSLQAGESKRLKANPPEGELALPVGSPSA